MFHWQNFIDMYLELLQSLLVMVQGQTMMHNLDVGRLLNKSM
jgi:hypothetical protein